MTYAQDRVELFKKALGDTTRTLSEDSELVIGYSSDPPTQVGTTVRLPIVTPRSSHQEMMLARGQADSMALRRKHHDPALHAHYLPSGESAREIYDCLENTRCDLAGAMTMPGVARNLDACLEAQARRKGYGEAAVPVSVADAIGYLIRKLATGRALPDTAARVVDTCIDDIETRAGETLNGLLPALASQAEFARFARQLIGDLGYADQLGDDPDERQEDQSEDDQTDDNPESEAGQEDASDPARDIAPEEDLPLEPDDEALDGVDASHDVMDSDDATDLRPDDTIQEEAIIRSEADPEYAVFTDEFDEEVKAEDIAEPDELGRLRTALDRQLEPYKGVVGRLANRLQRRLMAQQNRHWEFDREEGILDSGRLARIVATPTTPLTFKVEKDIEFRDTVVTLLLDNSGSMRGRPISIAALSADILGRTLERCQVKVELLGFTTRTWKGGRSREKWLLEGRSNAPGRLNDLRHIIYKHADLPWRRSRNNLGLMMKEGILKENIDGEALEWAHGRLLLRPEARKILMVVSDGAPVDDSTLGANPSNYLENHLRKVIAMIGQRNMVELIAIGIGHDVTGYYERAVTISDVEQLAGAMTDQLADLFDATRSRIKRMRRAKPMRTTHRVAPAA